MAAKTKSKPDGRVLRRAKTDAQKFRAVGDYKSLSRSSVLRRIADAFGAGRSFGAVVADLSRTWTPPRATHYARDPRHWLLVRLVELRSRGLLLRVGSKSRAR